MIRNILSHAKSIGKHLMSGHDDNDNKDKHDKNECCHVFCQMDALRPFHNEFVWKEVRRWVKFEEELEEDGKRWSKPHVSSLCMQYLTELHLIVTANPVLLDLDAGYMSEIVDILLEHWSTDGVLQPLLWNHVKSILLKKHKHQSFHKHLHSFHLPKIKSSHSLRESEEEDVPNGTANKGYIHESESNESMESSKSDQKEEEVLSDGEMNKKFKRKIPEGSEVMNIMVGEIEDLRGNLCAFIRLRTARDIGMITEVDLPTRFLFILLVPKGNLEPALEAGRCMGTLITDEIFREIAYKAENYLDIISGIQEFTSQTTVLPPGCWNPATRIEPPESVPTKEIRKAGRSFKDKEPKAHIDPTLQRTGRLFGGLIADVKRKLPWYKSDYTDALHIQCVASFIYLYLATLTPNVTFGGMLGKATGNLMGPMECILAAAITGVVFALFSGQPLNILGSTGPMLVLEMILYKFCIDQGWDYMPFRCWVGLWVALLIFIIVAFDLSALVRYITRFTEECFACLIALIFIYQAFENLIKLEHDYPVEFNVRADLAETCMCSLPNTTLTMNRYSDSGQNDTNHSVDSVEFSGLSINKDLVVRDRNGSVVNFLLANCSEYGGTLTKTGCDETKYYPDVFFLSVILFLGTFGIATALVNVKSGRFATSMVRQTISDFGVLIAIILMVVLDALLGIPTPKLSVPSEFKPSNPTRDWFINPISDKNPWWLILAASVPAVLTTILVFMDQQITAVIVNRQQHKLQKGSGYHLDMLVLGVLIVILSLLGLPWYVAATVSALAHILSLKRESECTAPGEKPQFLGVREQRVTALLVGILSGFSVLLTSVLNYIPMPVLFGVFLYMGVAALNGMQLVQRISIMFMPQKYQPDYKYLRHVPLKKVHLFTAVQIVCLVVLWVIKSIHTISIVFPLMVLATIFVRRGLDFFFSEHELRWLDGSGNARKHKKTSEEKPEVVKEEEEDLPVPKTKKEKRASVEMSIKQRCRSLPASVNMKYQPTLITENETKEATLSPESQQTFDKRNRKISLMTLPSEKSYRRESEHVINKDFQQSMSILHQALSQENIDGVKNQEIFGRRKSRRPSLLTIPSSNQSCHL